MKYLFVFLAAFVSITPAQAERGGGGWESSGGELFRDSKNPWFLPNVTDVQYCVRFDAASMNATEAQAKKLIIEGFRYWKNEFARSLRHPKGFVELATQNFIEIPCELGIAQIEFVFGHGALSTERAEWLEKPSKYIGVSVRTDYDTKRMTGKGFVYISSDRGPHSYLTSELRQYSLIPEAWKKETLLYYALLHEIGHLFGIPHTGSGLMSEIFLEQLLNQTVFEVFLSLPIEPFFFPDHEMESCNLLAGAEKAWFGADLDATCIKLVATNALAPIQVLAKKGHDGVWLPIGSFTNIRENLFDIRHRPAVHVQLTEDQTLFTEEQAAYRSFMIGGLFYDAGLEATYQALNSPVPKGAYLRMTSSSLHVIGTVAGRSKSVFNHNSWIATKLYLSRE